MLSLGNFGYLANCYPLLDDILGYDISICGLSESNMIHKTQFDFTLLVKLQTALKLTTILNFGLPLLSQQST